MGLRGQAAPSTVKFAWPRAPPPPAYLALVPVRAPHAPWRWHVPASAPLFRGGLRAARPIHPVPPNSCQGVLCAGLQMRGRAGPGPRSQGSGEQGAGQGTAFGQSSEAEGLRGEQDSRVPPARPPGPQAGRGEGSREVVAHTPTSSVSAWLGRDRDFPLQGASQGQSRLSRHGPPGLAGLSSSKEANLFFIQNPYKTIEQ